MTSKRGRPAIAESIRKELLFLLQSEEGRSLSYRSLGQRCGLSAASVSRILKQEGLSRSKLPREASPVEGRGLRGVAARAGVSVSTASRALRGEQRVRPETRQRVEAAARDMGYQPHPYVSAQLAAVRRGRMPKVQAALAYLWERGRADQGFETQLALPYGPGRRFHSACEAAQQRGYRVEAFRLMEAGRSSRRLQEILHSRGIRGVIFDAPHYFLRESGFDVSAFQCISFEELDPEAVEVVRPDFFRDLMHAFLELWERGYRRIGFLSFDSGSTSSLFARSAGFHHAQMHVCPPELRIPLYPMDTLEAHARRFLWEGLEAYEINRVGECDWLMSENWDLLLDSMRSSGWNGERVHLALLGRWLERHQPDALLCEHMDTIKDLEQLGYRVPEDIAVAHVHLNEEVAGWSGIRRPEEEIAALAVQRLLAEINVGRPPPSVPLAIRLPGTWVEGHSTARIADPDPPLSRSASEWVERMR